MGQAAILVGVTVAILVYLSPLLWLVLSSFKNRVDIFTLTPKLIFAPTLDNCREAFQNKGFDKNLINSIVVALVSTAIALGVGVPAAYSLSRQSGRFQGVYLLLLLGTRLLPAMVLSVPLFLLAYNLGLSGTYTAVIAAYLTFSIPFTVWMVRGFFMAVPSSLDDAARMDGCSHLGAFLRIVLPLTRGGLAATSIFCLINSWNEFLFALILTAHETPILTVVMAQFVHELGMEWHLMSATAVIALVPALIVTLFGQKYVIRGLRI
jgi:multiple sugar transport system permease protein